MADKLIDVKGIGPIHAKSLAAAGLHTTDDLLKAASTQSGRSKLAVSSGLTEAQILEWVNRADLMRIRGVGTGYSDLLESTGVDTVKELAQRVPANLQAALAQVNAAKKLTRRTPNLSEVQRWVVEAKLLLSVTEGKILQASFDKNGGRRNFRGLSRPLLAGGVLLILGMVIGAVYAFGQPGKGDPDPIGAAVLTFPVAQCDTTATVTFSWQPGGGDQWLDLSPLDGSFAPGTFLSSDALQPSVQTLTWPGDHAQYPSLLENQYSGRVRLANLRARNFRSLRGTGPTPRSDDLSA